jgi:hypothetical protein
MTKRCAVVPVSGYRKDFCIYMNYELASKDGDVYYFKIPGGHICRLFINSERWKNGLFDKEKFLKNFQM